MVTQSHVRAVIIIVFLVCVYEIVDSTLHQHPLQVVTMSSNHLSSRERAKMEEMRYIGSL